MGKVRKLRQKYHISLKKSKSASNLPEEVSKGDELASKKNLFKSTDNIFAGIDINFDSLTKTLPKDFDTRSLISTKSRKELKEEERHMKKKDKLKLRHQRFLQKLDFSYQAMQNTKKNKKQKKSYNSMSTLLDALPSSESLPREAYKKKFEKPKAKAKPKGILKTKDRLKQQSSDSKLFRKMLNNKKFKGNPLQAINELLKQKVSFEE